MQNRKSVIIWLSIAALVILGTVMIGGITRLTHSGLSMVDWRPLMGFMPPTSEEQWNEVFDMYKQYPQYQKMNLGMSLSEFKSIYFWEYLHRISGRLVGLVFFLPWLYFLIRKRFSKKQNLKYFGLILLVGVQGVLGWYMVQSGLVNNPQVSHYRLAAHLSLALALLGAVVYEIMNLYYLNSPGNFPLRQKFQKIALFFTGLVIIQIFYGALVAGLKAGLGYNTFPTMSGFIIPPNMFMLEPGWVNLFDNNITVQFLHRLFAWLILISASALWLYSKNKGLDQRQLQGINILASVVFVQFILGVLTLVYVIPVPLAVAHQGVAALLLIAAINVNHSFLKADYRTNVG